MTLNGNQQHEKCSESWSDWKKNEQCILLTLSIISRRFLRRFCSHQTDLRGAETRWMLNHCLGGYNQNNNKSSHATVWHLAPKSYSSGKKVLHIATNIAVYNFIDGLTNPNRWMWKSHHILFI